MDPLKICCPTVDGVSEFLGSSFLSPTLSDKPGDVEYHGLYTQPRDTAAYQCLSALNLTHTAPVFPNCVSEFFEFTDLLVIDIGLGGTG